MKPATASSFSRAPIALAVDLLDRGQQQRPALGEELVQDLVLRLEVVVDEAVGDAGLVGDVRDAAGVEALAREDVDRRVQDLAPLVHRRRLGVHRRSPHAWLGTSTGCLGPAVGARAAGWPAREASREPAPARRGRGRRRRSTPRRAPRRGPRPTGRRSSSVRRSGSAAAPRPTWFGAMTKAWFSIARARSRTSQWSLPVSRVKADGTRDDGRAAHGEDPVELGKAQVVADGHPERDPRQRAADHRGDDLLSRLLGLRLAVGHAAHVDVEHVDLAVAGVELAVGADQDRRVEGLLLALDPLGDAARDAGGSPAPGPTSAAAVSVGPSSGSAPS